MSVWELVREMTEVVGYREYSPAEKRAKEAIERLEREHAALLRLYAASRAVSLGGAASDWAEYDDARHALAAIFETKP